MDELRLIIDLLSDMRTFAIFAAGMSAGCGLTALALVFSL